MRKLLIPTRSRRTRRLNSFWHKAYATPKAKAKDSRVRDQLGLVPSMKQELEPSAEPV